MASKVPGWLPRFVLLSAIWGSSFALIKVAVDAGVAPTWVAFWRCFFGALALIAICAVQRAPLPRDPASWGHAMVVAALLNTLPFSLIAFGETQVSSVLAGMFNATTPLMTLVFAVLLVPTEHVTARRSAGLALGLLGAFVVLGAWRGIDGGTALGSVACVAATTCYGAGFAYTRRFFSGRDGSAAALSVLQIGCATAQLAIFAPLVGGPPAWPGLAAALALVALGAFATGIAYIINLDVIRTAGPTVAATVTYATPFWSTLLGAVLMAEPLGWNTIAGGALIIAGVVLTRTTAKQREVAMAS